MPFRLVILIVLATVAAWCSTEAEAVVVDKADAVVDWKSIPGDVTFEVPLNLTRLAPDITKVMVTCSITTDAFPMRKNRNGVLVNVPRGANVELPVSAGQLVTTVRVVIPVTVNSFMDPLTGMPKDPTGKSADYQCDIMGFSNKVGVWQPFDQKGPVASLQVSPSPVPITGTFIW